MPSTAQEESHTCCFLKFSDAGTVVSSCNGCLKNAVQKESSYCPYLAQNDTYSQKTCITVLLFLRMLLFLLPDRGQYV